MKGFVMATQLNGKRVAILVADGFEQVEMTEPRKALDQAGAKTTLISLQGGKVQGMNHDKPADQYPVEKTIDSVSAKDYDALLLPGGVANPDTLRINKQAVAFVKAFAEAGKPIAAICHGPWTLVEAGVVRGKTLTSWPSLKTDIQNAGGTWVDEEVHNHHGLITSRKPADIPAFNRKMIEEIAEGKHGREFSTGAKETAGGNR
jgi:protease I